METCWQYLNNPKSQITNKQWRDSKSSVTSGHNKSCPFSTAAPLKNKKNMIFIYSSCASLHNEKPGEKRQLTQTKLLTKLLNKQTSEGWCGTSARCGSLDGTKGVSLMSLLFKALMKQPITIQLPGLRRPITNGNCIHNYHTHLNIMMAVSTQRTKHKKNKLDWQNPRTLKVCSNTHLQQVRYGLFKIFPVNPFVLNCLFKIPPKNLLLGFSFLYFLRLYFFVFCSWCSSDFSGVSWQVYTAWMFLLCQAPQNWESADWQIVFLASLQGFTYRQQNVVSRHRSSDTFQQNHHILSLCFTVRLVWLVPNILDSI